MIISKPHLVSKLDIWAPKYSTKHSDGQWVVLISKYKVHHATSQMIINFSKAKHLQSQRFAITRDKVQRCPVTTNGKIECYEVPFDMLEHWDTPAEAAEIALRLFP